MPFGLTFNSYTSGEENLYKYNSFEEQKETGWYDYLARYYDPALGRFLQIDPLADAMRRHSPYNYAFDNPVRFIDSDGMGPTTGDQNKDQKKKDEKEVDEKKQEALAPTVVPAPTGVRGLGLLGILLGFIQTDQYMIQRADSEYEPKPEGQPREDPNSDDKDNPSSEDNNQPSEENGTDDDDEYITLYRGVGTGNSGQHKLALVGTAIPLGMDGGHSDPARHNEGDNWSTFTSWTTRKTKAKEFASYDGPGGVILEKRFKISRTVSSPDRYREGEVLIQGIVRGAIPTVVK